MVYRNDSLCHQRTCEDMYVDEACADEFMPDCVCPETMYLKDGECVDIEDCYVCEVPDVDGGVKRVSREKLTC